MRPGQVADDHAPAYALSKPERERSSLNSRQGESESVLFFTIKCDSSPAISSQHIANAIQVYSQVPLAGNFLWPMATECWCRIGGKILRNSWIFFGTPCTRKALIKAKLFRLTRGEGLNWIFNSKMLHISENFNKKFDKWIIVTFLVNLLKCFLTMYPSIHSSFHRSIYQS